MAEKRTWWGCSVSTPHQGWSQRDCSRQGRTVLSGGRRCQADPVRRKTVLADGTCCLPPATGWLSTPACFGAVTLFMEKERDGRLVTCHKCEENVKKGTLCGKGERWKVSNMPQMWGKCEKRDTVYEKGERWKVSNMPHVKKMWKKGHCVARERDGR